MGRVKSGAEFLRGISAGLRISANRPNIWGYIPHEKQVHCHTSPGNRLFIGGNRSGKTVVGATEAVYYAVGKHPYRNVPEPPTRIRVIAVDFLNGVEKIVKPEIARWVPPSALRGGSWSSAYDKELRTLNFENGSFIEFMSYDQDLDKFAGASRHFIWFDEEPPHDIWTENKARLIDTGGNWLITMTPVEGMTWVYDDVYIAARTDPNISVIEVDMTENPHLNPGEVAAFTSGLSDDERKARVSGKFVQVGGLVFKMFGSHHIVDPFVPDPREFLHVVGMDHGFNNPTAFLWCAIDRDGRIFVWDEHYESGQIVGHHANVVHLRNREHGFEPAYYVGDPSIRNTDPVTGTSVQLEYMDYGIPIMPANNEVRGGLNRIARYLEGTQGQPRLFITRNCINLLYEMQRYRWAVWQTKKAIFQKNKKEEPHKKDDHAVDALRYTVASRPEHDDGSQIPDFSLKLGTMAAPADGVRTDPGVLETTPKQAVDFYLGSEW